MRATLYRVCCVESTKESSRSEVLFNRMKSSDVFRKGRLVAKVLTGAWRDSNLPELDLSASDLDEVTPLLYGSGTAALGWHRLSKTQLRETAAADQLHQAYRLQSLHSELQEQKIEKIFRLLREAGVEVILAKGWAAARRYPDKVLRPYGDIDLCVRPRHYKLAEKIVAGAEARDCWVDLHRQFSEIDERALDDLFSRSQVVSLGSEQIRILGLEDQLALSSIHLLRHGAWRPLWLCDVGVIIENLPEDFDWQICLGTNPTRTDWILSAMRLAKELLGANTERAPAAANAALPGWLVESVLKQWENPTAINQPPMSHPVPIVELLKRPSGLIDGLRQRWPNPILATISVNGRFNDYPRLPYQMANCLSRLGRVLLNRPGELHEH